MHEVGFFRILGENDAFHLLDKEILMSPLEQLKTLIMQK